MQKAFYTQIMGNLRTIIEFYDFPNLNFEPESKYKEVYQDRAANFRKTGWIPRD